MLTDKETKVRQEAAEGLADIGTAAKDAALALGEALKDADSGVRERAASALNKLETAEKGLVPALVRALKEDSLQPNIIAVLVRIDADAVSALVKALDSKEAAMRVAVITTLGKIGPGAKDAHKTLVFLYRNDPAPEVRDAAGVALERVRSK